MNLKRAIEILDGGGWCSIRFITADINKGSGGKVLEFEKARVHRNRTSSPLATPWRGDGGEAPLATRGEGTGVRPNHHLHFTRNLELPNKQIRKVHPILITHLNQEEVI